MNKVFRAHPIMIFNFLKPFLFVLLIPVVRSLIQYAVNGEYDSILPLELALLTVFIIIGILRWCCFKLVLNKEKRTITIISGLFLRKKATLQIDKLSSIQTRQNPLEFLFGAVTYRINTEAGRLSRPDFEFKLGVRASKEVSLLLYGDTDKKKIKFSLFKIAVLAATTSSAFAGIIVGVPLIYRAGNLLGVAISDMLLDEINHASQKIESFFPPIVNTVTLILLIAYVFSFLYSLFAYFNFQLRLGQDNIEMRMGLFVRKRTSFKKAAINNVRIEQSIVMAVMRRFAMRVSVGGYGERTSRSEVVIPLEKGQEIRNQFAEFLPFFKQERGVSICPKQNVWNKSRFLFFPMVFFISAIALAIVLGLWFEDFTRFVLFCLVVVCVAIFCYAWFCLFEFHKGKIDLGENVFARTARGFHTCELYCPKENIGEIKLIRYPADLWNKTCRFKMSIRSERADTICVRHLDYKTVKEVLNEYFNINV